MSGLSEVWHVQPILRFQTISSCPFQANLTRKVSEVFLVNRLPNVFAGKRDGRVGFERPRPSEKYALFPEPLRPTWDDRKFSSSLFNGLCRNTGSKLGLF